jgi:hypothetical protein
MLSLRLSALVVAATLAGCSSVKIRTEFDPAAPFASYRSYAWVTSAPGSEQAAPMRDPRVRAQVVAALDREMAKKGLVLTSIDASPDFLVSVLGWSNTQIDVQNYGYAYGASYAYGPYGPTTVAAPVTQVREYTEGTLLLDFVDAKTKKLVWRGTATDTIASPESVRASIDEAARKLLEAYPPKPK